MQQGPIIPRGEYAVRCDKVQRILEAHQLDLLIAYADDRATYGAAHARYFANLAVHFEPVLLLFLPDLPPKLLCGPETAGYAALTGQMRDIRVLSEFAAENEDYPFTTVTPLKEIVKSCISRPVKRVGIAAGHLMGAEIYDAIKNTFEGAQFVRMDRELELLRGVKSPAELTVIRRAYEIAQQGMLAAVEAIAPGVTEREVAARAEYAMRMAGSEGTGIDTIVASGENSRPILARTSFRTIQKNDIVIVTVAPRYEGYHGAIGRTVIVGAPDEKTVASIEAGVRAQQLCGENLLAGRLGAEVEAMGRKVMSDAGYGKNFLYSGLHSIGVIEFEPPILGPSSDTVIENDMVISIDIPLFEADICGSRTEDGYIIANGRGERLTHIDQLIRK